MAESQYEEQALALGKAADIAIEAFKKFPPKDFTLAHIDHFTKVYLMFKDNALNPEPKDRNLKSLSHVKTEIMTYFQEGSGKTIDYFWEQVKIQDLGFKRENKLAKILKRDKIKNQIEYDFIIDVLVPYQQEGLIGENDVVKLNQMLASFEQKRKK
jgi:hypothetical protein